MPVGVYLTRPAFSGEPDRLTTAPRSLASIAIVARGAADDRPGSICCLNQCIHASVAYSTCWSSIFLAMALLRCAHSERVEWRARSLAGEELSAMSVERLVQKIREMEGGLLFVESPVEGWGRGAPIPLRRCGRRVRVAGGRRWGRTLLPGRGAGLALARAGLRVGCG